MIPVPGQQSPGYFFSGYSANQVRKGSDHSILWAIMVALLFFAVVNLAQADDTQHCLEFVRAEVQGALGPSINTTGAIHTCRRSWQSPRGWNAEVLIRWPSPPKRLCHGDQLSFRLEIESFKPYAKDPGGYAGTVFFDVAPSFREAVRCQDSDNRDVDGCGVYVMIPETGGFAVANTDIRVPPRDIGVECLVFIVRLSMDVPGTVTYIYQIIPREDADRTQHHDLSSLDDATRADDMTDEEDPAELSTGKDSDGDGITDEAERQQGTDPNKSDSDGDGVSDGQEIQDNTDPLDPSSRRSQQDDDIGPTSGPCADVGPGTWIVIGSRQGPQGTPVRIPVSLCGADRLGDLNLTINYGTDVLRSTGFQRGAMIGNALFDVNLSPPGTIRLGLADNQGLSGDGFLVYLAFDVIGAEGSRTALRGRVTTATQANNDQRVTVQVRNGQFTVTSARKKGDGDGDDRITSLDALMALRMSIGKIPVDLILDVNSDGQVTALDARWILQAATGLRQL